MKSSIDKALSKLWIFFGPGCLLAAYCILLVRANPLIGRPAWTSGLTFSVFVGCGIIYLTLKEILLNEQKLKQKIEDKEKELKTFRSVLDETNILYRTKIAALEQLIANHENEQNEWQVHCERIEEEAKSYKSQALSFQVSLEECLDELRKTREEHYLQVESGRLLPKDLPHQYKQLRDQFEEKSLVLDQTRRRLFVIEGQWVSLKKEQMLEKLDFDESEWGLILSIQSLLEENGLLQQEVALLERLVSEKFKDKKKKGGQELEQMLEFQLNLTE